MRTFIAYCATVAALALVAAGGITGSVALACAGPIGVALLAGIAARHC